MDLERLVKGIGTVGAKVLLNKKEKSSDKIDLKQINSMDIIPILLKRLIYEGDYNKAENVLFNELNNNYSDEVYNLSEDFYNLLLEKSDEELCSSNFSKNEVYQGLEDIQKLKIKKLKGNI